MLTNLIPGRYLFKLTVTDGSGLKNSDTASLIVKPGLYKFRTQFGSKMFDDID